LEKEILVAVAIGDEEQPTRNLYLLTPSLTHGFVDSFSVAIAFFTPLGECQGTLRRGWSDPIEWIGTMILVPAGCPYRVMTN